MANGTIDWLELETEQQRLLDRLRFFSRLRIDPIILILRQAFVLSVAI